VFTADGNLYTSQDADITDQLTRLNDANGNQVGYQYSVAVDNSVETYDIAGKLVSIKDQSGLVQTLTYSDSTTPAAVASKAGLLIRVTDSYGRQLNFSYDSAHRINKMVDPSNGEYLYAYSANNNLASITYPALKTKTYHYNEAAYTAGANLPHALTGITDENDVRFATYYYNAEGKAYKEHHAGGVNQYQIDYGSNGSSSTITDPLGTTRNTHFTTILGVIKATGQSQPGGAGCGPASSAITYDANGNVASRTDFNGSKTCHAYDLTRNLETARVEGLSSTADCATALSASTLATPARRITTTWHPTYRLPLRIAEPLRLTINSYDAKGNLESKTVQATTDATGAQGMAAAVTGTPRIWRYTYNQYGQVLTATGPRTDVADTTTYTYDSMGNLETVTNALGHVATLSGYDANGRVGTIVDANGLRTDLLYHPRGWLKSRTVTGNGINELTSYDYDGVGQLKKVTLPDNSWIGYDYDDAHRLTDTYDSIGNRITYTLDAMGNRLTEQVRDPSGALARQTTRIYDALNRLQSITGAAQ
jgi:YD repeat-containing protein